MTDTLRHVGRALPLRMRLAADNVMKANLAPEATLMREAADEIGRLRNVVRVNALRHGATHADVDVVLYGEAAP